METCSSRIADVLADSRFVQEGHSGPISASYPCAWKGALIGLHGGAWTT